MDNETPEEMIARMIGDSEKSNDPAGFVQKLSDAINYHGWDNRIGIPDYILAKMLHRQLLIISMMTNENRKHLAIEESRSK